MKVSDRLKKLKQKTKNGYYKTKIVACTPKFIATIMPIIKAIKKKDYNKAMKIVSENDSVRYLMMNNKDKIEKFAIKHGAELNFLIRTIDQMKNMNKIYQD